MLRPPQLVHMQSQAWAPARQLEAPGLDGPDIRIGTAFRCLECMGSRHDVGRRPASPPRRLPGDGDGEGCCSLRRRTRRRRPGLAGCRSLRPRQFRQRLDSVFAGKPTARTAEYGVLHARKLDAIGVESVPTLTWNLTNTESSTKPGTSAFVAFHEADVHIADEHLTVAPHGRLGLLRCHVAVSLLANSSPIEMASSHLYLTLRDRPSPIPSTSIGTAR